MIFEDTTRGFCKETQNNFVQSSRGKVASGKISTFFSFRFEIEMQLYLDTLFGLGWPQNSAK